MILCLALLLSLPVPVEGAEVQWVKLAPGAEFLAPGPLIRTVRLPTEVRFLLPDPDFGQVEFDSDVDGDGRIDHAWCGEVAALTVYNVAVAEGLWRPVRGFPLTPAELERIEATFEKSTGIPVEDDQSNAPIITFTAPYYPALAAIAGGPIGALVWAGAQAGVTVPTHAVVILGASPSGSVLVAKDCTELQTASYDWRRDYFLMTLDTLKALLESVAVQGGALAFFPLPEDSKELPEPALEALSGLPVCVQEFEWSEGSTVRRVRIDLYYVSSIDRVCRVVAALAEAGIPTICLVPTTIHLVAGLSSVALAWEEGDQEGLGRLEEVERLAQELAELRRRLLEEEARLADLERRVAELERRVADVEGRVSELDSRLRGLGEELERLEGGVARLEERVSNMERRSRGAPLPPWVLIGTLFGRSGARPGRGRPWSTS